jgi:putative FmdB family regulatory protein
MPLYEYQCENCGDVFEVIQKFSDEPLTVHEKCGGKVTRLLSAPALQFKGSGWYITDYAKGSNSPASGSGSKKSEGGESSSSSNGGEKSTASAEKSASTTKSSSSDTK